MIFEYPNCNVCSSGRRRYLGKRYSGDAFIEIFRCPDCGLIYPYPMPVFTDDEIQKHFGDPDTYFPGKVTVERIKKYDSLLSKVESLVPAKGRILDVGCGRGEFIRAARRRGWEVIGTEVSESFAKIARESSGAEVRIGDLSSIEFENSNFDVITLNSVIQYVADPLGTLKRAKELLKDNGILYIEVTNDEALVFKLGDLFESIRNGQRVTTRLSPLAPSYQLYGFNRKSFVKALENADLRIYDIETRGITGGGSLRGRGTAVWLLNMSRKAVIAAGGLIGMGHLIFCIAKKVT